MSPIPKRVLAVLGIVGLTTGPQVAAAAFGESWFRRDGYQYELRTDGYKGVARIGENWVALGPRGLIQTSADGRGWITRPNPSAPLNAIASNGSTAVAVGSLGRIVTSTNGIDWVCRESGSRMSLNDICWTGSKFVVVGLSGLVMASQDGVHWTEAYRHGSGSLMTIAASPDRIVALNGSASGGADLVSTDGGTTWQTSTPSQFAGPCDLTWGPAGFVATDTTPDHRATTIPLKTSPDGFQWTDLTDRVTSHFARFKARNSITWTGSNYAIFLQYGLTLVSSNALDWETHVLPGTRELQVTGSDGVNWLGVGPGGVSALTSDGISWSSSSPVGTFNELAFSGSLYVGVGDYGAIASSPDLSSWTSRRSGTNFDLEGIAWGNGRFVACGNSGTIIMSIDGKSWTRQESGTDSRLRSVRWDGGFFHAVSNGGEILRSPDGHAWTRIADLDGGLYDLAWAGKIGVAVGDNGLLRRTEDGSTWIPASSGTNEAITKVIWTGARFVAVGYAHHALVSTDGASWTAVDSPTGYGWADLVAIGPCLWGLSHGEVTTSCDGLTWDTQEFPGGASRLLWSGSQLVAYKSTLFQSSNGTDWRRRSGLRALEEINCVATSGSLYVATGVQGTLWHSADGVDWTRREAGLAFNRLRWAEDQFIGVGDEGLIATSMDGITWAMQDSGTTTDLYDVFHHGTRFFAVGSQVILRSTDAVNWTETTFPSYPGFRSIGWNGARYIAVGRLGDRWSSTDGVHWNDESSYWISHVTWTGNEFAAVGEQGRFWVSPDGENWSKSAVGTREWLTGVARGNNLYVVTGNNGALHTSPDGVTWTRRESGTDAWIVSVVWDGARFVAAGKNGTILVSADGISWEERLSGTNFDLESIVWSGSRFVAVGTAPVSRDNRGAIVSSPDGDTWTVVSESIDSGLWDVHWNGTEFMAVGSGGIAITSPDGLGWTEPRYQITGDRVLGVTWNGDEWIAVSLKGGIFAASSDPGGRMRWIARRHEIGEGLEYVAWNGTRLVVVGEHDAIATSEDSHAWTIRNKGDSTRIRRMLGTPFGLFALEDEGGDLYRSTDGSNWKTVARKVASIDWNGEFFVACESNRVLISQDGETWSQTPLSTTNYLRDIASTPSQIVAVGTDEIIWESSDRDVPSSAYDYWALIEGLAPDTRSPAHDPNRDGIPNLLAYVYGVPPLGAMQESARTWLPAYESLEGHPGITFEGRSPLPADVRLIIEASPDAHPGSWQTIASKEADAPWTGEVAVQSVEPGRSRVSIRHPQSVMESGSTFFRLRVEEFSP